MARPRGVRPPGLPGQLAARVEELRKDQGLDVTTLASRAGVGRGTVLRIEAGQVSPTLETILAIAHALGISGAALLRDCADWNAKPKEEK